MIVELSKKELDRCLVGLRLDVNQTRYALAVARPEDSGLVLRAQESLAEMETLLRRMEEYASQA